MATTSDIRNGMCIEFDDDIFTVVDFQHVKPGKGNAFVRTKLKSVTTGKTRQHTFTAGHKVSDVRIERRQFQFLYKDEIGYHFMNTETYEQVNVKESLIDRPEFLKEEMIVDILFHAEKEIPLQLELPQHIVAEITYTEPGVKGDTATNTMKPAKLDTGAEIKVPLFINEGEQIKVNTRTGEYIERYKE